MSRPLFDDRFTEYDCLSQSNSDWVPDSDWTGPLPKLTRDLSDQEKLEFSQQFGPAVGSIGNFVVYERADARWLIALLRKLQDDLNTELTLY